jgi:hypothetical protein
MAIQLRIDRLILEGLPLSAAQGVVVQRAVEQELARLLAEGGLSESWHAGGAAPLVQGSAITLAPGGSPAQVGAQIAQSLYSGLGGEKSLPPRRGAGDSGAPHESRHAPLPARHSG